MLIQPLVLGFLLSSVPATSPEPVDDWLDLDAEISTLSTTLDTPGVPAHISGRLITSYFMSRDPFLYTGSTEHASGVDLRSARLVASGEENDWGWKVSGELESGTMVLIDAWIRRALTATTDVFVGRFKRPVLQSGMVSSKYRLFWDRGNNGDQTNDRDLGVKLAGDYGQLHGLVSMMNGSDGIDEDLFFSGRFEYDLIGEPFDTYEGAYGAPEGMHLGFAAALADDGGVNNGIFTAYEMELTTNGFFLGADMMSFDSRYDELGGVPLGVDPNEILGSSMAGTSPFSVTSALLFGGDRLEVAGRIEVFDDVNNTSRTTLSFSIYDEVLGPRSRLIFDYADVTSDDQSLEGDKVEIGYVFVLAD